ncbi:uncharacterized protein LOC114939817 [Nylanderia fulva]|uniref:uncharacterized protein LOC114939817 n=1 Tax=Nylanderia fulva TaxID=613905 RepID=UPI0010FAE753|nr:uncharacterized protein LOC114939817 [Nylanderia fulva]
MLLLLVSILEKCRPKEPELTLVLGGDYNDFLRQMFFNMTPVALINETDSRFDALEKFAMTRYSYLMLQSYNFVHFLRKAHRFVVVASSQPILRSLLQRIKDSPWANSEGFYILVDRQTETRGCINAHPYLWTAWQYDMLSVIFICLDPDDNTVLYTYNPYSNSTPDNWYEVGYVDGREGHPWIILKRKFINNDDICINLDFDKTITLNNYELRLNVIEMEPFVKVNLSLPDKKKFRGDNSEIIQILLYKLKANLMVYISNDTPDQLGDIGSNGTFEGLLAPVSDGRIDVAMNARALVSLWKIRHTYPHTRSGLCVIAQAKNELSEFMKIIMFLSPEVMAGLITICLLTYAIFTRIVGYIKAGLEVIRLISCVGFLHLPKVDSTRIFICMVFILFININAIFESHLSSLLTLPVYHRNIDSIESLKDAGYTLYGPSFFNNTLGDPVLQSRYRIASYDDCKEHVENSSTAVCVGDCYHLYYRIKGQKNLIKSRMLREMIQSYVTREDWPLYQRLNDIIQQMMQAGLIKKSRDEVLSGIQRQRKRTTALYRKGFHVMLLKQLAFSFYFLVFGYAVAIVIFALEMIIGGSVPICQNWKAIEQRKKNTEKMRGKAVMNSKLSISTWR